MMYRKVALFGVFVSLLSNAVLPLHAIDSDAIKESNRKIKNLKQSLLCFKSKEGCSKRQIAGIISIALGLIAILSGAGLMWYSSRKKGKPSAYSEIKIKTPPVKEEVIQGMTKEEWEMTPEALEEVLQQEDLTLYVPYLKAYIDKDGNNAFQAAKKLDLELTDARWEYLERLLSK
jgi:hypothetical protein